MEQQVGKNRTSLVTFLSTSIEHGSQVRNSEKKTKEIRTETKDILVKCPQPNASYYTHFN